MAQQRVAVGEALSEFPKVYSEQNDLRKLRVAVDSKARGEAMPHSAHRVLIAFLGLGLLTAARGQSAGELTGTVADPSGAGVAGAQLQLVNRATGTTLTGITNPQGVYRFPALAPGSYALTVRAPGFAETRLTDIIIEVNRITTGNVTLSVASVRESIEVSATAQLLDFESGAKGHIISGEQLRSLPLQTRNPLALMTLTPGVVSAGGGRAFNRQGADGTVASSNFSVNGGTRTSTGGYSEYVVDGISVSNQRDGSIMALPAADALAEFRVQSGGMSAEYGRTVGGVINYSTRGGGNQFHGNLFELHRSTATNARLAIPATAAKPPNVYNQFGGSLGGPVLLPRLYEGRNRTFFHFVYDGSRWVRNNPQLATVPTARMKKGDFGELSQRIYDPATAAVAAQRQPFPENRIPEARFNGIGRQIVSRFPDPNRAGLGSNYQGVFRVLTPVDNYTGRFDQVLSDAQRLMFRVTWVDSVSDQTWVLGKPDAETSVIRFPSRSYVLNYVWTASPALVFTFAGGYTKFHRTRADASGNTEGPGYFGMTVSPAVTGVSNLRPTATFDIYRSLGSGGIQNQLFEAWQTIPTLSWTRGAHTLRAGGDLRRWYSGGHLTGGAPNGSIGFSALQTSVGAAGSGDSVASALLGLANSFSISRPPELRLSRNLAGLFFQDDWKITRTLTLNLGLRWDLEGGMTEALDRVGYFDPNTVNPLVNRPGVFRYAGRDGNPRSIRGGDYNNVSPRLGFAWVLDAQRKTTLRGAAGAYAGPVPMSGWYAAAVGFEPVVQFVSPGGGAPATVLTSSYSVPEAAGPLGDAAYLGQSFLQPWNRALYVPRIYQWNFGFQREIGRNTVLEAIYTGNRGSRLMAGLGLSLPDRSLIEQAIRLTETTGQPGAAFTFLNERVPNPLAGKVPGALGAATVTRSQASRSFPHFAGVSAWLNNRDSIYHALQLSAQRRFAGELSFLFAYTLSKQIENVSADAGGVGDANTGTLQNPYELRDARAVGSFDRTHLFTGTVVYGLPFGKGKPFASRGVSAALLGGFQLNLIALMHTGGPIAVTQANTNGLGVGGARPDIVGKPWEAAAAVRRRVAPSGNLIWFDRSSYALVNGRFGTAPIRDPRLRNPGFAQFDIGLQREFRLAEALSLRFRAEAFNAFNRVNLLAPVQNINSPDFGQINASNDARIFQFGLELRF